MDSDPMQAGVWAHSDYQTAAAGLLYFLAWTEGLAGEHGAVAVGTPPCWCPWDVGAPCLEVGPRSPDGDGGRTPLVISKAGAQIC